MLRNLWIGVAGFVATLFAERADWSPALRQAMLAGFLGAYTTFSTFAYQTVRLQEAGRSSLAAANVVASVAAGLVAAWVGVAAARAL